MRFLKLTNEDFDTVYINMDKVIEMRRTKKLTYLYYNLTMLDEDGTSLFVSTEVQEEPDTIIAMLLNPLMEALQDGGKQ